jgi:DNA repair photolyase
MARQYEPLAEPPAVRLSAIRQAAEAGYNTWISMEPPLPYVWIHRMIEEIDLDQMGRPWVVLGKLSYQGENDELRDWAKSGHWRGDRDKARGNLTAQGYTESMVPQSGSYYIKNNLAVAI